jgi:hypothetical protein
MAWNLAAGDCTFTRRLASLGAAIEAVKLPLCAESWYGAVTPDSVTCPVADSATTRYSAPTTPAPGLLMHPSVVAGSTIMCAPGASWVGEEVVRQLAAVNIDGEGLIASLPQPQAIPRSATSSKKRWLWFTIA